MFLKMSSLPAIYHRARMDHIGLDFDKLLRVGIEGIIEEINTRKQALNFGDRDVYPDLEVMKKYDFYACCLLELEALLDLAKRYAQRAYELAEAAEGPRKQELMRMAQALEQVPAKTRA